LTRSATVGVRRDLQASAGRSRVQGCQRWDRLPASRKKTPGSGWRRSEGSLDRQPAKDRAASADAPRARRQCVPMFRRSSVCAVKPTPTRAAACLNRTRRRESTDSLVLVAKRRLSEFEKDASFPIRWTARPGRAWIARLGKPTTLDSGVCIEPGDTGARCLSGSDSNRCREAAASALSRVEGRFRTEGGPGSRVSSL
jgi:hypothetical protein